MYIYLLYMACSEDSRKEVGMIDPPRHFFTFLVLPPRDPSGQASGEGDKQKKTRFV